MTSGMTEQQMVELIQQRVTEVAALLALDESTLFACLPHLAPKGSAPKSPFSLVVHAKSTDKPLNGFIDHTVLKAEATAADIENLCHEAKKHNFAAVCVNGCRVGLCKQQLAGSSVKVAAVVGFPLGADDTKSKEKAAADLFGQGVDEVDMVLNVGKLKDKDYHYVHKDIHHVVAAGTGHGPEKAVKVILETCLLTPTEIVDACILSVFSGAAFVKTSTGFGKSGATVSDVQLMKLTVGNVALVKASGGIRSTADAAALVAAGASRLGTSAGVAIVQGQVSSSNY